MQCRTGGGMAVSKISSVSKPIKYKLVTIPSITLTPNGYIELTSYKPSGMNNFLFAGLINFTGGSQYACITIDGNYLFAKASATLTNVKIQYYYTD